jgi:hypothetical protein
MLSAAKKEDEYISVINYICMSEGYSPGKKQLIQAQGVPIALPTLF